MSHLRFSPKVVDHTDDNGNVLFCRECGANVRKPFLYYCCWQCAHTYRMRTSQHYARRAVIARCGWCCARCGVDCRELEQQYIAAEIQITGNRMAVLMRRKRTFAHAHHKVAVVEGGGEATTVDDFELLCVNCHAAETTKLRTRLTKVRRKQRLTAILRTLVSYGEKGASTADLMRSLQRSKSPLSKDLKFLRHKGHIERSKRGAYYITALGRDVIAKLQRRAKFHVSLDEALRELESIHAEEG
jgi:predicted transcriptional regulator